MTNQQVREVMMEVVKHEESHKLWPGRYLAFSGPLPTDFVAAGLKVPPGLQVGAALLPGDTYCVVGVRTADGGSAFYTPARRFISEADAGVSPLPKPCLDVAKSLWAIK